jgi:tryptophan synthase alpha chain
MTNIGRYIESINGRGRKVLSLFLTAGFPTKKNFVNLALNLLDYGADILEVGIPFSDPLADGPTIQYSSSVALENGTTMTDVFNYCSAIKARTTKPAILMGYANPILKYGVKSFCRDAYNAGAEGLIVPDVPLDEYDSFYSEDFNRFDVILLTTPTSSVERIKEIDNLSRGFVYCVSVTGTTGRRQSFSNEIIENLRRTYSIVEKNKMLVGFGITCPADIKAISDYCDGVIVGSAVISKIREYSDDINKVGEFIASLSSACVMVS